MRSPDEKLVLFEQLDELASRLHKDEARVVTTNGCFDILHLGHIEYLAEARRRGDVLVCGVNSDASVRKLKGPSRPLFDEDVRARQLAALECVDYVTIFSEDTPEELIRRVRPAIHVKGGDYAGRELPERKVIESVGGQLVLLPFVPGYSTTSLLARLKNVSQ